MKNEINKDILKANNLSLKKKTSVIPIAILVVAALTLVVGICIENSSDIKMPVLLLAVVLGIFGIAKIFNMPMVIVDESHNEILREEELYFNLKDKSSVTEMLRRGEITKLRTVAMDSVNYPLKVELYTNQAGTIALYRVYHFIPYTYEPVTDFEIYRE